MKNDIKLQELSKMEGLLRAMSLINLEMENLIHTYPEIFVQEDIDNLKQIWEIMGNEAMLLDLRIKGVI